MSQTDISIWLKFALQQMAAESYLEQLLSGRAIRSILVDGNNDTRFVLPDTNGNLPGQTRFTDALVDRFTAAYSIVSHHANDSTGFSATLMQEIGTNNFTRHYGQRSFGIHRGIKGDCDGKNA